MHRRQVLKLAGAVAGSAMLGTAAYAAANKLSSSNAAPAIAPPVHVPPAGGITVKHGEQLIGMFTGSPSSGLNMNTNVGPNALLKSSSYPMPSAVARSTGSVLAHPTVPSSQSFWRIDNPSHGDPNVTPFTVFWSSSTQAYVYNNSPSNHGGIVPAGGMAIDGYPVPGGTYVFQFMDLQASYLYFTDWPTPIMFRGCRARFTGSAPGWFSRSTSWTQNLYLFYCDIGGTGATVACEVGVGSGSTGGLACLRCYVSYTTTGIQANSGGLCDVIECYVEKISLFGSGSGYHLNGIDLNGGNTNCRFLRNHSYLARYDDAGNEINQTDAIALFQDFGDFPGTGTNPDGTLGYLISSNYCGGGAYTFYLGQNEGTAPDTVNNLTFSNNLVTTTAWPDGGIDGPAGAIPSWGNFGNSHSNNLWADGPNAGQSFI